MPSTPFIPWPFAQLQKLRAEAISNSLAKSSQAAYSTALRSYLEFCRVHNFEIDPTPDTLSYYVVYMCHFISPRSVDNYLSGICNSLEPFYPNVRTVRMMPVVKKTLAGCMKMKSKPIKRKRALEAADLIKVVNAYENSSNHDDLLFLAQILSGFAGLNRLGELVWPDNPALRDWRKLPLRKSVIWHDNAFSYVLPGNKADRFFEGNTIFIPASSTPHCAFRPFTKYIDSRDKLYPGIPELWLLRDGSIPTRAWFINRLKKFFPSDVSGHSMRAGGATALALDGVPDSRIQAAGRWSSDAFEAYIRKNPLMIYSLISGAKAKDKA